MPSADILSWGLFFLIVTILLVSDLGFFSKNASSISVKKSLTISALYIAVGAIFSFWILYKFGTNAFLEYLTCFFVEKSLSLDNIFFISLVFAKLSIPEKYQHRVLFWGIVGVIVMRAIMITVGVQITHKFGWMLYIFSIFLIFTGIKLFIESPTKDVSLKENFIYKWMHKYLNFSTEINGNKFVFLKLDTQKNKKKIFFTPLFIAMIIIEFGDLIFALDSIPAVLLITDNSYVIYTSNIFAIMGLRALFFALEFIIKRFYYMKFSLAAVLIFIGAKVFIAKLMGLEKIPAIFSVGITMFLLTAGYVFSLLNTKKKNTAGSLE